MAPSWEHCSYGNGRSLAGHTGIMVEWRDPPQAHCSRGGEMKGSYAGTLQSWWRNGWLLVSHTGITSLRMPISYVCTNGLSKWSSSSFLLLRLLLSRFSRGGKLTTLIGEAGRGTLEGLGRRVAPSLPSYYQLI